jgi:hypothetical protein
MAVDAVCVGFGGRFEQFDFLHFYKLKIVISISLSDEMRVGLMQ